jgi:stage V sporulation protein D (sporulation-specific penicillin-binding protein)
VLIGKEQISIEMSMIAKNIDKILFMNTTITVKPIDGKDLTLTIDERIQELAEKVSKETLAENSAKSVSITIMDPNNGEILAMANSPNYNLNN